MNDEMKTVAYERVPIDVDAPVVTQDIPICVREINESPVSEYLVHRLRGLESDNRSLIKACIDANECISRLQKEIDSLKKSTEY